MFSLCYNFLLFLLGLIALPKLLWDGIVRGKYRQSFKQRLGFQLPNVKADIWIHTISVGETRAVIPLYALIRQNYPQAKIVISTITETGQSEAKRSLPGASAYFYLPLDFSWIMKKCLREINPKLLILSESDFWFNLLNEAKKSGAKIALVNGKLSDRSFDRFQRAAFFSSRVFPLFDLICAQNAKYAEQFTKLGATHVHVTGNLKLDIDPPPPKDLGLQGRMIVIASTHEPEEEWLLSALDAVWALIPDLKVLLVPRHPERFATVATHLHKRGIRTIAYSQIAHQTGRESVILIDTMGLLPSCYPLAEVAIVGGSFVDGIGGHNIFEPIACGVPVLFGPHMDKQSDLAEMVLKAGAGKQVTLTQLPETLLNLLQNGGGELIRAAKQLTQSVKGSSQRTWDHLNFFFPVIK